MKNEINKITEKKWFNHFSHFLVAWKNQMNFFLMNKRKKKQMKKIPTTTTKINESK
jgi:hypothetical protein